MSAQQGTLCEIATQRFANVTLFYICLGGYIQHMNTSGREGTLGCLLH